MEIGPNLMQAVIALAGVALAVIALLRQKATEDQVARNSDRLADHSEQLRGLNHHADDEPKP